MHGRFERDDVAIAYEDTGGDGSAVVFVHGLGGCLQAWRAQVELFVERGFRVIAYDQRGAGASSKPSGPYSMEAWADDLIALLDALDVDRAALVGHSMATVVVEHAAQPLGERCAALALVGGAIEGPPAAVFEERVKLARAGRMNEVAEAVLQAALSEACRAERPELVGLFLRMIAANDPEAYAASALAVAGAQMLEPGRVPCPTLAVSGELDPVTPPAASEAIAAAIPGARAATIPQAAHWCQIEAPAAVNETLLEFLGAI